MRRAQPVITRGAFFCSPVFVDTRCGVRRWPTNVQFEMRGEVAASAGEEKPSCVHAPTLNGGDDVGIDQLRTYVAPRGHYSWKLDAHLPPWRPLLIAPPSHSPHKHNSWHQFVASRHALTQNSLPATPSHTYNTLLPQTYCVRLHHNMLSPNLLSSRKARWHLLRVS